MIFGLDQVQGAALRREDIGAVFPADAERPEPVGITEAEDLAFAHEHDRERALDTAQRRKHASRVARLRQQVQDDLAINRGLKDGALAFEFLPQLGGVDQIAVMTDRDLPATGIDDKRLRVFDRT